MRDVHAVFRSDSVTDGLNIGFEDVSEVAEARFISYEVVPRGELEDPFHEFFAYRRYRLYP